MNASLLKILACPRNRSPLHHISTHLVCAVGHRYAIVDGIPVFLLSEEPQTHIEGTRSLAAAESGVAPTPPTDNSDPNAIGYWTTAELARTFGDAIGPSRVFVDGYFSLNPQISDIHLFPRRYRTLVRLSEGLRKMSQSFASLARVADSLYVSSQKQ